VPLCCHSARHPCSACVACGDDGLAGLAALHSPLLAAAPHP
jgi:hypothetical protein